MRGGITNHHSIACCLSNISAKNYQNRLMCVEVIVCYISVVFWDTVYLDYSLYSMSHMYSLPVGNLNFFYECYDEWFSISIILLMILCLSCRWCW